jgi:hypothetical protein
VDESHVLDSSPFSPSVNRVNGLWNSTVAFLFSVPHSPVRPVRSTVLIWTASCSPVRELAQDQQSSGGAWTRPPAGDPDDWILQRSKVLQKDFIIFI